MNIDSIQRRRRGGTGWGHGPPTIQKKKKKKKKKIYCNYIFVVLFFFQLILSFFFYFKKGMQEGNKFKRIIFVFKILFFFISWNTKSLIKFYIEVFSNSHGYGKPIFI
jgi:hypothetical protein